MPALESVVHNSYFLFRRGPHITKIRIRVSIMSQSKNVQMSFLNHLRKTHVSVTIFLTNGVKLQGKVTWFDNFCIALSRDDITQLVYKHAVATIMPEGKLRLHDVEGFDNSGNV